MEDIERVEHAYSTNDELYCHQKNLFQCKICKAKYRHRASLHKHLKKSHNKRPPQKNMWCVECGEGFANTAPFRNHLRRAHNIKIEEEHLVFKNMKEFDVWKQEIETQDHVKYIIDSGTYKSKFGYICKYFRCNRTGTYVEPKSYKRPKRFNMEDSCKIGNHCTSCMMVKITENEVTVTYYKTHMGHSLEPIVKKTSSVKRKRKVKQSQDKPEFVFESVIVVKNDEDIQMHLPKSEQASEEIEENSELVFENIIVVNNDKDIQVNLNKDFSNYEEIEDNSELVFENVIVEDVQTDLNTALTTPETISENVLESDELVLENVTVEDVQTDLNTASTSPETMSEEVMESDGLVFENVIVINNDEDIQFRLNTALRMSEPITEEIIESEEHVYENVITENNDKDIQTNLCKALSNSETTSEEIIESEEHVFENVLVVNNDEDMQISLRRALLNSKTSDKSIEGVEHVSENVLVVRDNENILTNLKRVLSNCEPTEEIIETSQVVFDDVVELDHEEIRIHTDRRLLKTGLVFENVREVNDEEQIQTLSNIGVLNSKTTSEDVKNTANRVANLIEVRNDENNDGELLKSKPTSGEIFESVDTTVTASESKSTSEEILETLIVSPNEKLVGVNNDKGVPIVLNLPASEKIIDSSQIGFENVIEVNNDEEIQPHFNTALFVSGQKLPKIKPTSLKSKRKALLAKLALLKSEQALLNLMPKTTSSNPTPILPPPEPTWTKVDLPFLKSGPTSSNSIPILSVSESTASKYIRILPKSKPSSSQSFVKSILSKFKRTSSKSKPSKSKSKSTSLKSKPTQEEIEPPPEFFFVNVKCDEESQKNFYLPNSMLKSTLMKSKPTLTKSEPTLTKPEPTLAKSDPTLTKSKPTSSKAKQIKSKPTSEKMKHSEIVLENENELENDEEIHMCFNTGWSDDEEMQISLKRPLSKTKWPTSEEVVESSEIVSENEVKVNKGEDGQTQSKSTTTSDEIKERFRNLCESFIPMIEEIEDEDKLKSLLHRAKNFHSLLQKDTSDP